MNRNIRSLDGMRAISILLVIVGHSLSGLHRQDGNIAAILGNAALGVNIFFVISGFLITHLLLREHEQNGRIDLPRFYARRAFRILPPFYLYCAVVGVLVLAGVLQVSTKQFLGATLFIWDYFPTVKHFVFEHTWSLSVEEQFYVFWPLLLMLALRRSRAAAARIAILLIAAAPLLRLLSFALHVEYLHRGLSNMLHTRIDAIMFGCLVALAQDTPWFEALYRKAVPFVPFFVFYLFVLDPILVLHGGGVFHFLISFSVGGVAIAVTMLWLIRNAESLPGRVLNSAPMRWIGVLSYSLYIWQTIFLHEQNHSFWGRYPANYLWILLCACASYYLVERPALRLRDCVMKPEQKLVAVA